MIMEIVKRDDVFEISEVTDSYIINGIVTANVNGDLNMDFRVNRTDGSNMGNGFYNKYAESNRTDLCVSFFDSSKDEVLQLADTIIKGVVSHLKHND